MIELIKILKDYNINQLIIIYSIYKKNLTFIKERNSYSNIEYEEYKKLADLCVIEELQEDTIYLSKLILTDKGLNIAKQLISVFKEPKGVSIDWIDDWYNLFPKAVKNKAGYFVRTDKTDCKTKLEKFITLYPEYGKDVIIKATNNYINLMRESNYAFMQKCNNFIFKDGQSTLLSYVENIDLKNEEISNFNELEEI